MKHGVELRRLCAIAGSSLSVETKSRVLRIASLTVASSILRH